MRMHVFFLAFLVGVSSTHTWAQSKGKLFGSAEGYKTDYHHVGENLFVKFRTDTGIFIEGGNYYKVYSSDKTQDSKFKHGYWAVELNDSLFLNGFRLNLGLGYVYAERVGEKLFFLGATSLKEKQKRELGDIVEPRIVGGLIGHTEHAFDRCYYILNLENEQISYVAESDMLHILQPYPELLNDFRAKENRSSDEIITHYLNKFIKLQ